MVKKGLRTLSAMLLGGFGIAGGGTVFAQDSRDQDASITIIQPDKTVEKAEFAAIDTERFELGVYTGSLSVEDFGNSAVTGLAFTFHIDPRFIAQLGYGQSDVGRAAFEEALGNDFLSDSDKEFTYTHVTAGYRLFYGRSFFGARNKFNTNLYLTAGLGNVEFAGDTQTGLVLGATYKVVLNDWLTCDIHLRDHIFEREFLDDKKTTQNVELAVGINFLF